MSFQKKLVLIISFLLIIPLGLTSIFTYFSSSSIINQQSRNELNVNSQRTQEVISALIDGQKVQVESLSNRKEIIELAKSRMKNQTETFFSTNPQLEETNKVLAQTKQALQYSEDVLLMDNKGIVIANSSPANMKIDLHTRDYFQEASLGKVAVSKTVISKATRKPIIVFSAPVKDENNQVIAVVAIPTSVEYFAKSLGNIKIGKSGYAFLLDSEGIILFHPDKEKITKPVDNGEIKRMVDNLVSESNGALSQGDYNYRGEEKLVSCSLIPGAKWVLAVDVSKAELNEPVRKILLTIATVTVIFLIIAIVIGNFFARRISIYIEEIMFLMEKAAKGDLTVEAQVKSQDEVGRLSDSFNEMIKKIRNLIQHINETGHSIASSSHLLASSTEQTSSSIESVATAIQEIASGSSSQANSSEVGLEKLARLGKETDEASERAEEMNSISSIVTKMNESGKNAVQLLFKKTEETTKSSQLVEEIINNLKDKSISIGEITNVIGGIADQTNLLALNAAIEAARAGEQGRGFAVVAEEVRKLAEQSSQAVSEIAKIIGDIQNKTEDAVGIMEQTKKVSTEQIAAVDQTGQAFEQISDGIENITAKISEVTQALAVMNKSKDEIISFMQSIASVSEQTAASAQEVSASTEEQTAAMEEVASLSEDLNNMVIKLEEAIKVFKI